MKKLIFMLLIILIPIKVIAKHDVTNPLCTDTVKEGLRKKVNNVIFLKEKDITNNKVLYTLKISEISPDIFISYNNKKYKDKITSISEISPGTIINLDFYAKEEDVCGGYKIYTEIIQIPYYNKYIENNLCTENKEYFLCKENVDLNITEEEFTKMINEYIESKKNITTDDENKDDNKENDIIIINKIMDFLSNYYIYILWFIILSGTSGIVVILLKKRRNLF